MLQLPAHQVTGLVFSSGKADSADVLEKFSRFTLRRQALGKLGIPERQSMNVSHQTIAQCGVSQLVFIQDIYSVLNYKRI